MDDKINVGQNLAVPKILKNYTYNYAQNFQWTNNSYFYVLAPQRYWRFYNSWVKVWLQWFDGYVPWIHNGDGVLSTRLATTIVSRVAESIVGGGIMFENANSPTLLNKAGISEARLQLSKWAKEIDFNGFIKKAIKLTLAGGSALLKVNIDSKNTLWCDVFRMDRFFADVDYRGEVVKSKSYIQTYTKTISDKESKDYVLVEERYYVDVPLKGNVPIIEFKLYQCNSLSGSFEDIPKNITPLNNIEEVPKDIRNALKNDYGKDFMINKPKQLPLRDLGCYLMKATECISNLPQLPFGESILNNVQTYLYLYDYYASAFNTDMYLGRGRVIVPKQFRNGKNGRTWNAGLDNFMFDAVEYQTTDDKKPEAIQFELRSQEWVNIRNNLLESIATSLGISVSTLASYLNDSSNRTAREVSAEESATTLMNEDKRRIMETTINKLLKTVTVFYGFVDDINVRWSRAGMTNVSVLTDTLTKAVQGGLISQEKAHKQYNFDDDDEQIVSDYKKVLDEKQKQEDARNNSLFGDLDGAQV